MILTSLTVEVFKSFGSPYSQNPHPLSPILAIPSPFHILIHNAQCIHTVKVVTLFKHIDHVDHMSTLYKSHTLNHATHISACHCPSHIEKRSFEVCDKIHTLKITHTHSPFPHVKL